MSTQSLYGDLLQTEEPLQEQSNSYANFPQPITNVVELTRNLPKEQVLAYLNVTDLANTTELSSLDLGDGLAKQTVTFSVLTKEPVNGKREPRHIVYLQTQPRQHVFISLQKWEGVVLEVMADSFLARLVDLTHKGPDEEAEFLMEEISEEDKALVRRGAIFYWNIGYLDSYSGQRTRTSVVRFRRLPAWTREEIEAAEQEAERIGKSIGWE